MSQHIANLFIKDYEPRAHHAFQQMGKNLAKFCRVKNKVKGKDLTFPKIGRTSSGTKTRGADITPSNPDMSQVVCVMENQYHRFDIEDLDQDKTNVAEQMELIVEAMNAMQRWEDGKVLQALADNTEAQFIAENANTGLTKDIIKEVLARAGKAFVFENQMMPPVALIGDEQWSNLLDIDDFSNADYVGMGGTLPNNLGTMQRMKMWRGVLWCVYSSLPYDGANSRRTCYLWDSRSVGVGRQRNIQVSSQYYNKGDNLVVTHKAAQGAVVIDSAGVFKFNCQETYN